MLPGLLVRKTCPHDIVDVPRTDCLTPDQHGGHRIFRISTVYGVRVPQVRPETRRQEMHGKRHRPSMPAVRSTTQNAETPPIT